MDDLAKKLSDLLNSPEGMQKLQQAAASFGMFTGTDGESGDDGPPAPGPEPEAAGEETLMASSPPGGLGGLGGLGGSEMETIARLMPLLSSMKGDDENTLLLKSLRPFLGAERQGRLEETIKILRLLKILPLLGEKGLF